MAIEILPDKPEGCNAVTVSSRHVVEEGRMGRREDGRGALVGGRGETKELTLTTVCGQRSFELTRCNTANNDWEAATTAMHIEEDAAALLGAMCINCPNRTTESLSPAT
jgi:hypothetical protein